MISIAIDGPSGAGKSTLAQRQAERLGYLYVDTGALYRAIGLAALRAGLSPGDEAAVTALLPGVQLGMRHTPEGQRVFLAGEDVSDAIRAEEVSMAASAVSAHPSVRAFLLETQRRLARENDVVMDGRDIGTVVLPDATVKIYLTATPEDRARRRLLQLHEKGMQADYDTVLRDVRRRDDNDMNRPIAPLRQADDAVLLDTTGNSFEESLAALAALIDERLREAKGGGR